VAFLGNSHTYTHDVPGIFRAMLKSTGKIDPMVDSLTRPAAPLIEVVREERYFSSFVAEAPDGAPWDIVIAQEQSGHSSGAASDETKRKEFHEGLISIIDGAKQRNPNLVVVLYQTWAWHQSVWDSGEANLAIMGKSHDEMHQRMRQSYALAANAAREHVKGTGVKVIVSPVGDFWTRLEKKQTAIDLHNPGDGNHASPAGAWLAAATLVGSCFGRDLLKDVKALDGITEDVSKQLREALLSQPEIFHNAGK
jgi:hypothetical protein